MMSIRRLERAWHAGMLACSVAAWAMFVIEQREYFVIFAVVGVLIMLAGFVLITVHDFVRWLRGDS